MFGIVVLTVYATLMIGVTLIFTRRAASAESFHVADRRIGAMVAAMSIAATWIWAPSPYRRFFIKSANMMTPKSMRTMHDALVAGDPKLRSLRALFIAVYTDYANYNRADLARRKEAQEG